MGQTCPHCGMESDDERICSWCGKSLVDEATPTEGPERPIQEAADVEPPSAKPPVETGGGRHQGAAAAMMAAEADKERRAKWPYYLAVVASLAFVIFGWSAISLRGALQLPKEPGQWQSVGSENEYLHLQVPDTWEFSTGGSRGGFEQVTVKSGKFCLVKIRGTQALGALADATGARPRGNDPAEVPFEETGMGMFHAKLGGLVNEEDPNYEEAAMQPCTFAGGTAAYSTYTTVKRAGVLPVNIKGWRITTLSIGPYAYSIHVECPEKHWDKFQPIASNIIGSVTRG